MRNFPTTPFAATSLRRSAVSLLAVAFASLAGLTARAADLPPDLAEIAAAGEVVIGVREDAMPFAFIDVDGRPKGYAVDVCNRVVENLRIALNRPDLRVRYNGVTVATRTLLVREKVVDMECGATSNTKARQSDYEFSVAYGVEQAQLISLASKPVNSLQQLKAGETLLVTDGSTSSIWLKTKNVAADQIPVRNAGRAFFNLVDGKANAYVGSGEVFLGEVLRRGGKPSDFKRVTLTDAASEPLAVMMRKGQTGLKQVADDTIRGMAKSGELAKLYGKWFEAPISTRRMTIGQPMSLSWQAMVEAPNDQPVN